MDDPFDPQTGIARVKTIAGPDVDGPHGIDRYAISRDPDGPRHYWCRCGAEFDRYIDWMRHHEQLEGPL